MAEVTPMMKQYLELRDKYKDCILFYRLGDFYELFYDQAELCSRELELTLTGKDCGQEQRAPMCGIPFHAINTYIPKMVEKGYKVAICEQVEDPKNAKGLVKRDVVKIITPGTITDSTMLDEKKNNYIASIIKEKSNIAFSFCDISTGEFKVTSFNLLDSSYSEDYILKLYALGENLSNHPIAKSIMNYVNIEVNEKVKNHKEIEGLGVS